MFEGRVSPDTKLNDLVPGFIGKLTPPASDSSTASEAGQAGGGSPLATLDAALQMRQAYGAAQPWIQGVVVTNPELWPAVPFIEATDAVVGLGLQIYMMSQSLPATGPAGPSAQSPTAANPDTSQKPPETGVNDAKDIKKPINGETAATARGREAHKNWDPGPGFKKETSLPSGKRADAVNKEAGVVKELKPDNARAIRRGERQVEQYRQELQQMHPDKCWTCKVETYKP